MKFHEARRQQFLDEAHYHGTLKAYGPATIARENTLAKALAESSGDWANIARVGADVADGKFLLFSIKYTAGAPLNQLREQLVDVVVAYERYAEYDRKYREEPALPAFAFRYIDDYVRCIALLSLAILLHREDLIPRLHDLIKDSAFDGQDALYEELLGNYLSDRPYLDEWHHDLPYLYLLDATAGESDEERVGDIQSYLKNWYKHMKGCGWYDTHKHQSQEGGGYFGYWAWEVAAVA